MVEPRLSRGLRDSRADLLLARQHVIDTARKIYELYGFTPLETPAIEYLDVLSGSAGQEAQGQIFRVTNPEEEPLGLRFDLTVPLSRVVSQYKDLVLPFRRYQVSPVWRADKPAPGRFREFYQFDLDSVGVESEIADTEILAGICDTLDALDVGGYRVRFSSRKILNLLLMYADIEEERGSDVFRVLDKLDKTGRDKIRKELTTGYIDESGDPISGVGLSDAQVDQIDEFLEISGDRNMVLAQLGTLFHKVTGSQEELEVVGRISSYLDRLGYKSDRVAIDVSIARGLSYYTGPIFEAVLLDAPQFGSVFGGGRYDDLVTRFTGQSIPSTGASLGVDRLVAALLSSNRLRGKCSTSQVFVTAMDQSLMSEYLTITYELRRAGIASEMHLGKPKKLGKQIQRADRLEIPYVVIMGSDEAARGVVTLKEMDIGREKSDSVSGHTEWKQARFGQQEIARAELVKTLKRLLAENSPQ
tara:strand:+ start:150961 stop:152379 length:1419 start_codon:yes stop_codon:yes gene_type:complete